MAIEIFSDNSDWTAIPRLSFSGDLSRADRFDDDHREDSSLLQSPSSDFCFCVPPQYCSSSADQLFCNGKILPLAPLSAPPQRLSPPPSGAERLQEVPDRSNKPVPAPETTKSFWGAFSRSSSLNITKSAFLCSLNRLTRSRSVGTNTTEVAPKKAAAAAAAAVPPKSAKPGKRPTWKKKDYGIGVNISPVLNIPTPHISKGKSSLFNFRFFLCRKEKNRKACF